MSPCTEALSMKRLLATIWNTALPLVLIAGSVAGAVTAGLLIGTFIGLPSVPVLLAAGGIYATLTDRGGAR